MSSKWQKPLLSLIKQCSFSLSRRLNLNPRTPVWIKTSRFSHNGFSSIFALSSGHGKCGVAVIRVSGPHASSAIVTMGRFEEHPEPRKAYVRRIYHSQTKEFLDKALIMWFAGPRSFTGEDCCEFQVHGGRAVVQAVLDSLQSIPGLRHAEPGEFTKRAFINHKLDLTEVEGLGDLIHADTEQQRRQAVRQMDGALSNLYNHWREIILKCVANVEAFIDFSEDDDIEDDVLLHVEDLVAGLTNSIRHHLADHRRGERLRDGCNICILGQPNVGKSSLLNVICQRPAAIVSPLAGTTRDVVERALDLGGYPVLVGDTAGLRTTTDPIEQEGVRRATETAHNADLRVLVIDSADAGSLSREAEAAGLSLRAFVGAHLRALGLGDIGTGPDPDTVIAGLMRDLIVVFNKHDLHDITTELDAAMLTEEDEDAGQLTVCHISCETDHGVDGFLEVLRGKVAALCGDPSGDPSSLPSLTQARHRHHLNTALQALEAFTATAGTAGAGEGGDMVLAAQELRIALRQIGKLTGNITSEEILDVIFKDFCIGK